MSNQKKYTIDDLITKCSTYIKKESEISKIRKAYEFAAKCHNGQYRLTKDEYINHPLNVAIILIEIYSDCDTICAGLLHDIYKTDVDIKLLEQEFGKDISDLVYGINKIGKINFSIDNDYLIEYYKKIIIGMSEDVRVIIVKLADRLHNMRTLWALPIDKQKESAKETLEIFAPIAHHLGINKIKSELEDLALRYLKPDVFYDIAEKLNNTKLERDNAVNDMMQEVSKILNDHNIVHEIKGRSKSIYSIYNKLNKGKKFNDIYDLLALRILVKTEQECYLALGIIHAKFKPMPNRFKDYIAMPKANMYQSLHTTVFGIDSYLFEIQIRTYEMDEVAENGIAAHWAYKENGSSVEAKMSSTEQKLQFFKSIIELNEEKMSSEEFVNSVKDEVLNNNIYVFTPKGDVIELPKGATPVDFAYRVHSKIGESMIGAIVNNAIVPLDYELKDNDIIKINTSKSSSGPSKEWLKFVKCTQTKNKIKAFFSKNEKELYLEKGKDLLEKELRKKKLSFTEFLTDNNKQKILKELKLDSQDDLYLNIGNNKYSPNSIINIIYKKEEEPPVKVKPIIKNEDSDIIVEGIDKIKVSIANCCNPVPQDDIIGYITKGNGITIHRKNCHNLLNIDSRIIDVKWNNLTKGKYLQELIIYTTSADNKVFDIIQQANINNINIDKINTVFKENNNIYELGCYVNNLDQLNKYIKDLQKDNNIIKVERLIK